MKGLFDYHSGWQLWRTEADRGKKLRPTRLRTYVGQSKEDSPEPPRLSLKPSRLEGQLDDPTVLRRYCNVIAE
jgi:hypothetical protein